MIFTFREGLQASEVQIKENNLYIYYFVMIKHSKIVLE